jgi:uncharacterized protein YdhG (YjbR/CyaY superfamily)
MLEPMKSDAKSVEAYIAGLPEGRRDAIAALRATVLKNLPDGYVEVMNYGMISYEVPLAKPLMYAAIASQKNHMAIYLCALTVVEGAEVKFVKAWNAKRKPDLGKSCLRFKALEEIDLELIGNMIAATSVEAFQNALAK